MPLDWEAAYLMRPQRATAATTSVHMGNTAKPGTASATKAGSKAHCQPRIMKSSSAVAISTAHCTGGTNTVAYDTRSDVAATRKARATRVLNRPVPLPSWAERPTDASGGDVMLVG